MIQLSVVNSICQYCSFTPKKWQKSKPKPVTGFQINFLSIYLYEVDYFKVLRGGIQKIWVFHLPYHTTFLLCFGEERNKVQTLSCEGILDVAGYGWMETWSSCRTHFQFTTLMHINTALCKSSLVCQYLLSYHHSVIIHCFDAISRILPINYLTDNIIL